jgi:hypothetical protein
VSGTVLPVKSEASWLGVGALLHGEIGHLERIGLGVEQLDVVQPIEVLQRRRSVVLLRRELLENT